MALATQGRAFGLLALRDRIPVRWWVAVLLVLSYVVWYMDRTNISICGPVMLKDLGWSAAEFGLIQSAFFVGYGLSQIPLGWVADRFGGSKLIVAGTLWWSLFVFLTPFAASLGAMSVVRALMGVGQGVNTPAHTALTVRWMPRSEAGMAQSFYFIGMPAGIIIAMPATVWLTEGWGWPASFYVFAVLGVAWCGLWWWYGRDRPERHPSMTAGELARIRSDQDSPETLAQPTAWRPILTSAPVWGLTLAYFFHNYLWNLYIAWLPGYLVMARGFSLLKSGLFTMIPYMVACLTIPLGGFVSDVLTRRFGPNVGRRVPIAIGMGGSAVFLILGAGAADGTTAIAYISASVGCLTFNYGAFWSIPINLSPKDAGLISGIMNTGGNIAGVLAPFITGVLVTLYSNRFETALYFGAALAAAGIVILFTIGQVRPVVFEKS